MKIRVYGTKNRFGFVLNIGSIDTFKRVIEIYERWEYV